MLVKVDETWGVMVLGAVDSGKTALINEWGLRVAPQDNVKHDRCALTWRERIDLIDGKQCRLEMSEPPRWCRALRDGTVVGWNNTHFFSAQMRSKASIYFVIYSVADRKSFEEVIWFWLWVVPRTLGYMPIIILIGTQTDKSRQVSQQEGAKLAKECRIPFFEVNTMTGYGRDIEKAVFAAVRLRRKWRFLSSLETEAQWPAPFRVNHRLHEYPPSKADFSQWQRFPEQFPRPMPLPLQLDLRRAPATKDLPLVPVMEQPIRIQHRKRNSTDSTASHYSTDSGFSDGSEYMGLPVLPHNPQPAPPPVSVTPISSPVKKDCIIM